MNRIRIFIIYTIISAFGFSLILFSSCRKKSLEGTVFFTQVSGKLQDIDLTASDPAGQKIQSVIASLDINKHASQPDIVTKGFYSARSPDISCDGEMMLFSAQQKEDTGTVVSPAKMYGY